MSRTPLPLTIPISIIANATISLCPYDPKHMLVLTLPPEACGKITLPRDMFSDDLNKRLGK